MTEQASNDAQWEEFVREFEKSTAKPAPTTSAGAAGPDGATEAAGPAARRRSRTWPVLAAVVLVAAAGSAGYLALDGKEQGPTAAALPPIASPSAPAAPSAPATAATAAASPSASPSAARSASGEALSGPRTVMILGGAAFPGQVDGYTLVSSTVDQDCAGPGTVGPTLAGLIGRSHGCLGVARALYKDAGDNQYDLALFVMREQLDAFDLVNGLSRDLTNRQVVAQARPEGSGLRALPAGSGVVQALSSYGPLALVGAAQWSDGRTADLNDLVGRLTPLTGAIIKDLQD
ncbi:hypothetical protein ACIQBJ_16230 [Kitasatospora sp. NPDC088391]|uniref:hypothetical protein n=1 Tax=Kitasatospora sp. NPDC088391 TaxID=3364074 RepID=UPI00382F9254